MTRRLPAQQVPTARVIHYIDPAVQADLTRYGQLNPAEMVRQQQRNTELYLRWKTRQAEIKAHDRKFRRFWLSFGAVVGLAFLAVVGGVGWLIFTYLAALNLGVLAAPVVLLIASGLAFGGHRCVTIVQHWH